MFSFNLSPRVFTPRSDTRVLGDLHQAARRGDVEALKKVLEQIHHVIKSLTDEAKRKHIKEFLNRQNKRGNLVLHETLKVLAVCNDFDPSPDPTHLADPAWYEAKPFSTDVSLLNKLATVVYILLDQGVRPNELNAAAQTAIDCAIWYLPVLNKAPLSATLKRLRLFTEPGVTAICVDYLTTPHEEIMLDVLLKLRKAGGIITLDHIDQLINKGYQYIAKCLKEPNPKNNAAASAPGTP